MRRLMSSSVLMLFPSMETILHPSRTLPSACDLGITLVTILSRYSMPIAPGRNPTSLLISRTPVLSSLSSSAHPKICGLFPPHGAYTSAVARVSMAARIMMSNTSAKTTMPTQRKLPKDPTSPMTSFLPSSVEARATKRTHKATHTAQHTTTATVSRIVHRRRDGSMLSSSSPPPFPSYGLPSSSARNKSILYNGSRSIVWLLASSFRPLFLFLLLLLLSFFCFLRIFSTRDSISVILSSLNLTWKDFLSVFRVSIPVAFSRSSTERRWSWSFSL
mmetsp:Transcript_16552/g.27347  ORF Transcript_16552/g.27347 Transcript_16552/m.27347 type:complete len:275 (+) Transcript_16552:179-1003(+)